MCMYIMYHNVGYVVCASQVLVSAEQYGSFTTAGWLQVFRAAPSVQSVSEFRQFRQFRQACQP